MLFTNVHVCVQSKQPNVTEYEPLGGVPGPYFVQLIYTFSYLNTN